MLNLQALETFVTNAPQGVNETSIPNVQVFWSHKAMPRHLQAYLFGLVFILQGYKIGYLGARRFQYGAGQYLAVGFPMHFECETHLQNHTPLLGIFIQLEVSELSRLAAQMMSCKALSTGIVERSGVEPLSISAPIYEVLGRMLNVINQPKQGAVLGELYVRELCYHVLQEDNSAVLLSHLNRSTPQNRVAQTLEYMEQNLYRNPPVDELAQYAHMSIASFNRHFKQITGRSVVQYIKTMRLMRARHMLAVEGQSVKQVAELLGYGSAAQLSRDFKAYFGLPPKWAGQV
ncbi:MAG: AraC family transcriptional regulator [Thiofilum sp.]|uniref:AraC family transcriptional regulator n=1 Tax=Thiofilum sp. TaxID=2212733 RepID=UPI0025D35790|nr:AraC family transcriptional regulator [Thiofilum sp.]MBK8451733.1 AraC family transcriptional regulator [Thiofilum sp.]